MSGSPKRNKFSLPPPPRITVPSSSAMSRIGQRLSPPNSGGDRAPPTSGVEPHASTASIPTLHSAPPSANLPLDAAASSAMLPSQQQQQQQPPFASPTMVSLPPPPPPPPRGGVSATTSSPPKVASAMSSSLPPPPAASSSSTLPPPPVVAVSNKTTTTTTTTPSLVHHQNQHSEEEQGMEIQFQHADPQQEQQPPPLQAPKPLLHTAFAPTKPQFLAKRQTHHPILLVATEAAHQMAWKNDLQLQDMLEGLMQSMLGAFRNSSSSGSGSGSSGGTSLFGGSSSAAPYVPPFRSVSQSLHLGWKELYVTFQETEAATIDDAQAAELLQQEAALQTADGNLEEELFLLEDQVDNLLQEQQQQQQSSSSDPYDAWEERQRQQEQVNKDAFCLTSPGTIPWLWRYRQALDLSTDRLSHELFHCPALALVVCTTQEEAGVLETVQALVQSRYYLPEPFQNGLFDPTALSHAVLVLHDNVSGPTQWKEQESVLLPTLQQQFGPHAAVLRINSISAETARRLAAEETMDLWGGGGSKGNCLSINDRVALRQYLSNLITNSLLPALERRVAKLNAVVSERKKGVRNVLKSFWRTGKSKDEMASTSSGSASDEVPYKYDSIENQTRLLADTLFLLTDYDAALSTYRLIKDDFKQDKAHAQYGSVQEMMALCLFLMDSYGRSRDIFSHIETALLSYSRAAVEEERRNQLNKAMSGRITVAPKATRCATRLCLVLTAATGICNGRHLEVADLLASASSNENALGAAVLLEQGSAHYFHASLFRKYAFHMLMSGHMFRTAEQHPHAFRCFTSALYIYRDGRWEELHNHLRSALAAQLFTMGRMAIALQLYAKLVGSTEGGRVSVKSQQKFVNHLLEICNEHYKKALAGADRMAAPSHLSGAERDAVRKEKLDRIVQVVRYTKSAVRVLELANVDLPAIDDSTVTVLAEEAAHHRQESVECFGEARLGSDEVWEEMVLATIAELKAADEAKAQVDDEVIVEALTKIEDPEIRKVIAEMDKEKMSRNLRERAKRSASYKEKPPVRAQMEPFFIEFAMRNPLGIPIDLVDLQLVARMKGAKGERLCTNEDAITITPLVSFNEKPKWNFHSTEEEFEVAHFCRISSGRKGDKKQIWKAGEEKTPFFVVTKTNVTLDAESRKSVSLGICPLEQGDLEVLGVRFRLFDDVWLYHPFDIKGPLLQNTRSNRANRVRGESMLLKSKVERGMPCLTAELIATQDQTEVVAPGPVLQGQIRNWTLRVTNIGTAAASNAVLKTNVPWIRLSEKSVNLSKNNAISRCIGPSGTLMTLPIQGSSLQQNGMLEPGESVDLSVDIRTSGAGKQEFYMLFRYELPRESYNDTSPRCRWLKKMFEVPVYPSLTLSAALAPSNINQGEHILSVELTNNRSDRPDNLKLLLETINLASWHYRLKPIPGQLHSTIGDSAELGWQERVSAHYRVVAVDAKEDKPLMSDCHFSETKSSLSNGDDYSLLAFVCLERAHEEFEENLSAHKVALARAAAAHDAENQHPRSIAQIRRANTGNSPSSMEDVDISEPADSGHPTSVTRLCPKNAHSASIHIICTWKGENPALRGEHHIRGLCVRPLEKARGCPITLSAKHPPIASNDFSRGPARVPFSITLHNRLAKASVSFEFAVDRPDKFDFSGTECFKAKLAGGEAMSFPMEALIPAVGVYNLQHVHLTVNREEVISYVFPLQWLVCVTDCS